MVESVSIRHVALISWASQFAPTTQKAWKKKGFQNYYFPSYRSFICLYTYCKKDRIGCRDEAKSKEGRSTAPQPYKRKLADNHSLAQEKTRQSPAEWNLCNFVVNLALSNPATALLRLMALDWISLIGGLLYCIYHGLTRLTFQYLGKLRRNIIPSTMIDSMPCHDLYGLIRYRMYSVVRRRMRRRRGLDR